MTTENPPAPAPSRAKSRAGRVVGKLVGSAVGIALVAGVGIGWTWYQGNKDAKAAPVAGECFKVLDAENNIETTDCAGGEAEYQVTSRVDGTADVNSACQDDMDATSAYYYTAESRSVSVTEFVLCIKSV